MQRKNNILDAPLLGAKGAIFFKKTMSFRHVADIVYSSSSLFLLFLFSRDHHVHSRPFLFTGDLVAVTASLEEDFPRSR